MNWAYDSKDRLTQEQTSRNGSYTHNFGYDLAGNPTTFKGAAQTFNADNQRTASNLAYDGNGNPTNYFGTSAANDVESRLKQFGSWNYTYRADGLRASKQQTGSQDKKYFLYDGNLPIVELDKDGAVQAINVYAPDGLVGRKLGSTWTYYQFDQQGNVAHRSNSSGVVTSSSMYDAYGVETSTASQTDPFGYNARWGYTFDRETGLYACMFRYYDPQKGRWLNRDPIGYSGGANLYGYCGGNPVNWADPSGLWRSIVAGTLGGIGGFIVGGIPGAIAGATFFGGLGAAADELDRQMVEGEDIDYGRAAGEGAKDAVIGAVGGGIAGKCFSILRNVLKSSKAAKAAAKLRSKIKGKKANAAQEGHRDPNAVGPHSSLKKRTGRDGSDYTQGYVWDEDGNLVGRVDVTDHGRPLVHDPIHFHPWGGPQGGWGPAGKLPWGNPQP